MTDENHKNGSHAGRPSSWISVGTTFTGFVIGGVAMTMGPQWVLLWVGVGITVIGAVIGVSVGVFGDVVVDEPRVVPEIVHYSLFGKADAQRRGGPQGETIGTPTAGSPQVKPHG